MSSDLPRPIAPIRPRRLLAAAMALLASVILPMGPAPAADAFVPGLEDVPLMPGLTVATEAAVLFDRPDGRIVEVTAVGNTGAEIARFYADTLPQLGWQPDGDGAFRREGERLQVMVERGSDGPRVRFLLKPVDAPAPR